MLVSEIYDDAINVLGQCDQATLFNRLTQAVRLLARKARWDSTLGEMDIVVCDGCVTLPFEVKTVLGVATNGQASYLQDQWVTYHLNGPGVGNVCTQTVSYTRIVGAFSTIRDPSQGVYLTAVLDSSADNNTPLRVFGWDATGQRIYSPNPITGALEDGFLVPTIYGSTTFNPQVPPILKVDRVEKSVTNGFVRLLGLNTSDLTLNAVLGIYNPFEVDPKYIRLKVTPCSWVRVKYQKHDDVIRSVNDWININDPMSVLMALKSIRMRFEDKNDDADRFEQTASRLMSEEQKSLQPNTVLAPQIINGDSFQTEDGMFYGNNGVWGANGAWW